MILYSDEEKRNIIMDYYLNPRFKKDSINENQNTLYIHSSSCVDEIKMNINKNNQIEYWAQGCAIFISSVEIFIERLNEVGWDNKDKLIENYTNLINQNDVDDKEILGKLNIYANVKKHLNRVECALLITKLLKNI